MEFVLFKSASIFPFDMIQKIEFKEKDDFSIQTESGCTALVRALFAQPDPVVVGPVPLEGVEVLEKSCAVSKK